MDSIENPFLDLLLLGSVVSATRGGRGTGRRVAGGGRGKDSKGVDGK